MKLEVVSTLPAFEFSKTVSLAFGETRDYTKIPTNRQRACVVQYHSFIPNAHRATVDNLFRSEFPTVQSARFEEDFSTT